MTLADDRPVGNGLPTHFMGICDECRSVKVFATAKAREQWEKFHPHQEDM